MTSPFCITNITTDQAYTAYIKKKILVLAGLFAAGVLNVGISLFAGNMWNIPVSQKMLSVYSGFGFGIIAVSIVLIIKNRRLLKDEKRLRNARIATNDERNTLISNSASKTALAVLLVSMYVVMLIGGLWYPVLVTVISFLVALYAIVYMLAYKLFGRKM